MKIKVVQMIYGDLLKLDSWFQWVEKINQLYCDIHGYEYIVDRRTTVRPDRHGNWMKVDTILDNLHDCDYLLSLEGDCAIYCHSISVEDDVLPYFLDSKSILTTVNRCSENWPCEFCSPQVWSMIFRNNSVAKAICSDWLNIPQTPECRNTAFEWPYDEDGFRWHVYAKHVQHIQVLKDYYLMATEQGYFIRHLSSTSNEERGRIFKAMWESPIMQQNKLLLKYQRQDVLQAITKRTIQ